VASAELQRTDKIDETAVPNQVRLQVVQSAKKQQGTSLSPLDVKYYGRAKREHVKEFGCLFGAICSGIAAYQLSLGRWDMAQSLVVATMIMVSLGAYAPKVLYPLWSAWMGLATGLGVVMSFLFVGITWCLMAVPLALILRLIGKKVMDLSFDRSVLTYWEDRKETYHDFKLLERQF
jgi:hypothetical protein